LPVIQFNPKCRKCHGYGVAMSRKGQLMPCVRCYRRNGYCRKCYGTGTNYNKNKPCKKCHHGKMKGHCSSSSSYSD
jgi:DnaJ-class molecular chaperone